MVAQRKENTEIAIVKNTVILNAVNAAGIETLRKNVSRFIRKDDNGNTLYISVSLATPDKNAIPDSTYGERRKSDKIVTNQGNIVLAELPDNARIAFSVKVVSVGNQTSYTHDSLKQANGESFTHENNFTVYTNGTETNGIMPHLGYDIPEKLVSSLIATHVAKLGRTQQWQVKKGIYSAKQ